MILEDLCHVFKLLNKFSSQQYQTHLYFSTALQNDVCTQVMKQKGCYF